MGEFFALLTAAFWAGAVILFKRSGETAPPLALNFYRVVVSGFLLLITMLVLGMPPWRDAPVRDYALLAVSGIVAIALADTLFHASLNRVGAAITAIVDCLYSPLVALFAFLILGETLTVIDRVGMLLVVSGVLVTAQGAPPAGATRRTLGVGIGLGALGMMALTFGIVIAIPVLERQPVVWATGMRQFAALAVLAPTVLISGRSRDLLSVFNLSRPTLRYALPGTVLGSYLALMCWIAGMKFTAAGSAAILNQTSTIYIILLARVFLREPLTRRRLLACLLALSGALCVVLG